MYQGQKFDFASRVHSEFDLVAVRTLHSETASAFNSISGLRQSSERVLILDVAMASIRQEDAGRQF